MRITTLLFSLLFLPHSSAYAQKTVKTSVRSKSAVTDNTQKRDTESQTFRKKTSLVRKLFLPQNKAEWAVNVGGSLIFTTVLLAEQQIKFVPWQRDKWNSKSGALFSRYDKVEHFGIPALSQSLLISLNHSGVLRSTAFSRIKFSLLAITWWEMKDSVADFHHYGKWGGEGFSTKDWLASAGGVVTTELLHLALVKIF